MRVLLNVPAAAKVRVSEGVVRLSALAFPVELRSGDNDTLGHHRRVYQGLASVADAAIYSERERQRRTGRAGTLDRFAGRKA
jgi:hypothetical protein